MDFLLKLIDSAELPLILTVSDLEFTKNLCESVKEFKIQVIFLSHTQGELTFQLKVEYIYLKCISILLAFHF
jgi:hypothetical protein